MKKFFMIVVLFCAATLISNADAIEDKDFEKFFNQFQKELKESKGVAYVISEHLSDSAIAAKINDTESYLSLSLLLSFASYLQTGYKDVCNLSAKNQYSIEKNKKTGKITYEKTSWHISIYEDNPEPTGLFVSIDDLGRSKQYRLGYSYKSKDGPGEDDFSDYGAWCVFAKINGEWKIIDFDQAG